MQGDRDRPNSDAGLPNLAGADWLNSAGIQAVFDALERGGYSARAVGGVVRNALLGEPIHDVDIATTAEPDHVMRLVQAAGLKGIATGAAHGTITVISSHVPFEVTTLRRDVETFGRHATVAFTTEWEEDARRRDFTLNALYCDRKGQVYDPVGGYADLLARRVRFIGDPVARIREDYLRILRFFRFQATYGIGDCDGEGLAACIAERDGLTRLSGERVRSEILRLLVAVGVLPVVDVIVRSGIGEIVFGRKGDVASLSHVAEIERALERSPDAILRLAALACSTLDEANALADRLRPSNLERGQLEAAVLTDPALGPEANLARAKACRFRLSLDAFQRAYIMTWARSAAGAADEAWHVRFHELTTWKVPEVPFKGSDVVALGVPPGPNVGIVLQQFQDWWIAADFPDDDAQLHHHLATVARPYIANA